MLKQALGYICLFSPERCLFASIHFICSCMTRAEDRSLSTCLERHEDADKDWLFFFCFCFFLLAQDQVRTRASKPKTETTPSRNKRNVPFRDFFFLGENSVKWHKSQASKVSGAFFQNSETVLLCKTGSSQPQRITPFLLHWPSRIWSRIPPE